MSVQGCKVSGVQRLPDAPWTDPNKTTVNVLGPLGKCLGSLATTKYFDVAPKGLAVELHQALLSNIFHRVQEWMWNSDINVVARPLVRDRQRSSLGDVV